MRYTPESSCTLTGTELNEILDTLALNATEINKLKEGNEDLIQANNTAKDENEYLESNLDKTRFEYKKTLALNQTLLKHYATNKTDRIELSTKSEQLSRAIDNVLSYKTETELLQKELKEAYGLISKLREEIKSYTTTHQYA